MEERVEEVMWRKEWKESKEWARKEMVTVTEERERERG